MREELHPLPLLLAEEVAEAEEEEEDSSVHSESPPPPPTPQNPTPPRMRRGSWTFNKSRERNKKSLTATSSTPRQRARSNSVPAVLSLTQLPLFRHSWIPQIVVSGEQPEAEPEVADVVEGFSWTLAESIIEDILKEMEASSRRPYHQLPLPVDTGSRKGILKNASNDSLYRSCSGSLEEPPNGSQSDNGKPTGSDHIPIPATVSSEALSWSHRSTSMPSLRGIDQDFRNSSGCPQVQEKDPAPAPPIGCLTTSSGNVADPAGSLPIITGNWGCGSALCGDPQLKSMIQWMAASRSGAPCVIYYTSGDSSIVKMDIVCRVMMDRHWTVADLARAVMRYCQFRLDPRHLQQSVAMAADPYQRHLFDDLLTQLPLKQTEL